MPDCLFCKIVNKEIPSDIVYEDDQVLAFRDIEPQSPVHILVIPKEHFASILHIQSENFELLGHIFQVCNQLAHEFDIDESGFRIVNNCKEDGGQTVNHLHFHLLGGRKLAWPPG